MARRLVLFLAGAGITTIGYSAYIHNFVKKQDEEIMFHFDTLEKHLQKKSNQSTPPKPVAQIPQHRYSCDYKEMVQSEVTTKPQNNIQITVAQPPENKTNK